MTDIIALAKQAGISPYTLAMEKTKLQSFADLIIKNYNEQLNAPTVPDNMQDWAGMDGTLAFHLIERHADNWSDTGKMMHEWLEANKTMATGDKPSPTGGRHDRPRNK